MLHFCMSYEHYLNEKSFKSSPASAPETVQLIRQSIELGLDTRDGRRDALFDCQIIYTPCHITLTRETICLMSLAHLYHFHVFINKLSHEFSHT